MNSPRHTYKYGSETIPPSRLRGSASRIVELHGRKGIHFTGIRGRLLIPEHTINEPQGAVAMWVLPLDDIFPAAQHPQHFVSNKHSDKFVLLSDREALREVDGAFFTLCYHSYWHPVFFAKFFNGPLMSGIWAAQPKAHSTAGHFEFERMNWYCVVLTWNHALGRYRIYANGVLVGSEDTTARKPFLHDPCGPFLYAGNPALVFSDMEFYDVELEPAEIKTHFAAGATHTNPQLQSKLETHWEGRGLERLDWKNDGTWEEKLSLPLNRSRDLEEFFHQGGTPTVRITPEGLRITTPSLEQYLKSKAPRHEELNSGFDMTRMYLWSQRTFEGDLYATFDFKLLDHGGLALFMANAAGMQGEDFLNDYFLRADGRMITVCWEDVRNYHWEFYREMCDVRNDLVSHAMLKNPWYKPMAFQMENRRWELDRWYRFEYLQQGNHIRGAIDGVKVIDVTDTGFDNNGPVLRKGRVAIRCMMRTDMVFRNLRVMNRTELTIHTVSRSD
jgi:hypothetical protein